MQVAKTKESKKTRNIKSKNKRIKKKPKRQVNWNKIAQKCSQSPSLSLSEKSESEKSESDVPKTTTSIFNTIIRKTPKRIDPDDSSSPTESNSFSVSSMEWAPDSQKDGPLFHSNVSNQTHLENMTNANNILTHIANVAAQPNVLNEKSSKQETISITPHERTAVSQDRYLR